MPVRVQMLGGRGVSGGGVPLLAVVLVLVLLAALAAVMLPLVLIAGGLGVLAFGALKLQRWAFGSQSGGESRQSAVDHSDFEALRAKLESRGMDGLRIDREESRVDAPAQDGMDDEGRRNVRVIDARQ